MQLCMIFSVQILDEDDVMYTTQDDPYRGLKITACVKEEKKQERPAFEEVKEEAAVAPVADAEPQEEVPEKSIDQNDDDDDDDEDDTAAFDEMMSDQPALVASEDDESEEEKLLLKGKTQCCKRGAQVHGGEIT